MSATAAVRGVGVSKTYRTRATSVVALDTVDIEIPAGIRTAIMAPTSLVFQAYNLVPALTARENILLPRRIGGLPADEQRLAALTKALGIADRLGHRPAQLSGGQQQRVAIARALISSPRVVFADEPTGNLDSRASPEIMGLLRHAIDELGQTVVLVTHDPVTAAVADQVLFLSGRRAGRRGRGPAQPGRAERVDTRRFGSRGSRWCRTGQRRRDRLRGAGRGGRSGCRDPSDSTSA